MTGRPSVTPPATSIEQELRDSLDEILEGLTAAAQGDLQMRLTPRYDDSHPAGALAAGVNAMVESLAQARAASEASARDLEEKINAIERQQVAIRELSTPAIEVWQGVLCMPVVGTLDSARTAEMTSALLSSVVEKRVKLAIVDITGISTMDTRSVDHLLRMAKAVRLLGARCVLSGVQPGISQTIVHMGLELQGIETHRTMRDALHQHVKSMSGLATRSMRRESLQNKSADTASPRSHSAPARRTTEG